MRTKKACPEYEVVWKSRYTEQEGRDVWRNVLELKKRFGKRSMFVGEVIHEEEDVQWAVLPQLRIGLTCDRRYHLNLRWDCADGSFFKGWR